MGLEELMAFVLVLVRVGCIFAFLPFLGEERTPMAVKAAASFVIALALFPVLHVHLPLNSWQPMQYVLYIGAEALLGVAMGTAAAIVFGSIKAAGELIGNQMGMSLAITADPLSGTETCPVGNLCEAIGVLMFFAMGGHHSMLEAMHASFSGVPLGTFLSAEFVKDISLASATEATTAAVQLSAPLMVLTFLISLVMALMARLVSEINVLMISFPLRIGAGLIGLTVFVPVLVNYCGDVVRAMGNCMNYVAAGG